VTKIHARTALLPDGWMSDVAIVIGDDGKIASVSDDLSSPSHVIDLVLPAPVNLHSHTFQRAMVGLTEARGPDPSDSFWTWRQMMYRFLDQLTPEQVEGIAAQAFVEMAEAGYAAVAEFHYLHHAPDGRPYDHLAELTERIAAAANATGIGLTHLPVYYEFGGCDGRALVGGQRRFGNDFDRYARLHDEARSIIERGPADWNIGVAPHSLRAVDEDGLTRAVQLAQGTPFHLHLAEQIAEVEELLVHRKRRPVEWLLDRQDIGETWCLIHCTQMNANETIKLAQTGAVAGLCPITESSLGDGIFDGVDFVTAGGYFGVGSDSNIQISLFEELKTLEYSQRLRDRSRAALANAESSTGRVLFDHAVSGGAKAVQRQSGAISPGQLADLCGLSTDNEWCCHRAGDTVLDSLIFSGNGGQCVREVWSAGRHIVRNGQHVARDQVTPRFKQIVSDLSQNL